MAEDRRDLVCEQVQTRRLLSWLESGEPLALRIGEPPAARIVELATERQEALRGKLIAACRLRLADIEALVAAPADRSPAPPRAAERAAGLK